MRLAQSDVQRVLPHLPEAVGTPPSRPPGGGGGGGGEEGGWGIKAAASSSKKPVGVAALLAGCELRAATGAATALCRMSSWNPDALRLC